MGHFTKTVTREFEFEGETATVMFRRLKRKDLMNLLPYIRKMKAENESGEDIISSAEGLLDELGDRAREYVISVSGITDDNGSAITVEDVVDQAYFVPLLTDILTALVDASMPGKE